jgi:hypothetical protein
MGMTCILGIMVLWNLVPNWRSEQELNRFQTAILEGDRNDSVVKAYSHAPYRGDMAALCATESIMIFLSQIALPPSPEPGKWEYLMPLALSMVIFLCWETRGYPVSISYYRRRTIYGCPRDGHGNISTGNNPA